MSSVNEELLEQMRERLTRIENGATDAEQRLGRYTAMSEELKQVTETATSPDRSVTVVAGPGGSVQDIKLTEGIKRLRPEQLSASIMDTMRQALAAAARKQAAVVQETVGDTDVLERVLKTQEQIFGVPMTVDGPAADGDVTASRGTSAQSPPSQSRSGAPSASSPQRPRRRQAPPLEDEEEELFQGFGRNKP